MKKRLPILGTLVLLVLCSCSAAGDVFGRRYYEIYAQLNNSSPMELRTALAESIGQALEPLGFTGGQTIIPEYYGYSLFGHERVDVTINVASMTIGLKDYRNRSESSLDVNVIAAIQSVLIRIYGHEIPFIPSGPDYFSTLEPARFSPAWRTLTFTS